MKFGTISEVVFIRQIRVIRGQERYIFELSKSELRDLRSKISTTNVSLKSRSTTKVFTGDKFLHWQAEAHSKTRATGGKRVISQLKHLYMM